MNLPVITCEYILHVPLTYILNLSRLYYFILRCERSSYIVLQLYMRTLNCFIVHTVISERNLHVHIYLDLGP